MKGLRNKLRRWTAARLRDLAYHLEPKFPETDLDLSDILQKIEPLDTPFLKSQSPSRDHHS